MTDVYNNDGGRVYDGDDDNSRQLHVCCVWHCCTTVVAWAVARERRSGMRWVVLHGCAVLGAAGVWDGRCTVAECWRHVGDVGEVGDVMGWL